MNPRLAAVVLSAALLCAGVAEVAAVRKGLVAEHYATARRHLPRNYCISCHSDAHTIRVMLEKEGRETPRDRAGGIFDPDGKGAAADTSGPGSLGSHHSW